MTRDKYFLHRLLRGSRQLLAAEKEEIFQKVFSRTVKENSKSSVLYATLVKPATIGWILGLTVMLGSAIAYWQHHDDQSSLGTFTPKGTDNSSFFSVRCGSSQSNRCQHNDVLGFQFHNLSASYFAAFAIHNDSGKIFWYFPSSDTSKSIRVPNEANSDGWLTQGIQLGANHPNGQYKVVGIASTAALSRNQIRNIFENSTSPAMNSQIASVLFELE